LDGIKTEAIMKEVDYFGIHKESKPRTKEKGVYVGKVIYLKVVSKW
jgi:hypothetical protein